MIPVPAFDRKDAKIWLVNAVADLERAVQEKTPDAHVALDKRGDALDLVGYRPGAEAIYVPIAVTEKSVEMGGRRFFLPVETEREALVAALVAKLALVS